MGRDCSSNGVCFSEIRIASLSHGSSGQHLPLSYGKGGWPGSWFPRAVHQRSREDRSQRKNRSSSSAGSLIKTIMPRFRSLYDRLPDRERSITTVTVRFQALISLKTEGLRLPHHSACFIKEMVVKQNGTMALIGDSTSHMRVT
jgi:hypothetical protein